MLRCLLKLRSLPVWVLWLALALPLAQVAAFGHGLSHFGADSAGSPKQATHSAPCDFCVAAAAVSGAAPVPTHAMPVGTGQRHVEPAENGRPACPKAPDLAYDSRAPPTFLR